MDFVTMMALEAHGTDVWVGAGPRYPWGGLYGGQIVAQALRAATLSVAGTYRVHSLHAYFIRPGDHSEPIRFEVDRVRNGRSFCTRRVTARQSVGVILNLTASFQVDEPGADVQTASMPDLAPPEELGDDSWSEIFERRVAPRVQGELWAWARLAKPIGDDPALQACALAYISDDFPTEAVVSLMPGWDRDVPPERQFFSASLDHAIWFHRPVEVDGWHVHASTSHGLISSRGVSVGHVFAADGAHLATVSQEVLLRPSRRR
ncbi:MAG TPA: acyl-CoA thioesterase domain-containing protein [Acidimicrobiales bacterium]|nr:acyl-CoA thioesterase domain-containing protein [Acidimicrobiales bacterium]